jgi:hypothetical protein
MSTDFRSAGGAFQNGRHLGEGQFLKTAEQEHLARVTIETAERNAQEGVVVTSGRVIARVGTIVRLLAERLRICCGRSGGGFAKIIGRTSARQVVHPRGKTSVIAIGMPVLQHALENRLRDIFGGAAMAGELYEEAKKRTVMTFEKLTERVEFTIANGEHEVVVRKRFRGSFHGVSREGANHGRGGLNTDF